MKKNVWKQTLAMLLAVCLTVGQLPLALATESKQGNIFKGEGGEPGDGKASVKVTLKYQYSPTGGMAGINAHAPENVEFFFNEDGTATTPAAWPIPYYDANAQNDYHDHDHNNLEGFRVVLNAAPLNELVKVPPKGNESPEELEAAMNRGDFDPDPTKATEEALTAAWIAGRTFTDPETGLIFQVVDKDGNAAVGSEALVGPQLKLVNPEKLRELDKKKVELTLEVNYRRDNGTYTVKHWIPKEGVIAPDVGVKDHWQEQDTQTLSGRIGAMTRAEAQYIRGYANRAISQQPIQADGSTVVDIFYTKDDTIRVIFDTSEATSGEIERQQLNITDTQHNTVDLSAISAGKAGAPVRPGYVFAGWAFQDKERDGALVPITSLGAGLYDQETKTLTPDAAFLNRAQLQVSQETAGVNVLQFYPMWEKGATSVRVVFWTEDLTGRDDVDSRKKGAPGELSVVTHPYTEEGAAYSNMGYYQLENVMTNCELEVDTETGELVYTSSDTKAEARLDLKERFAALTSMKIQTAYRGTEPQFDLKDASGFYTLDGWVVTQMEGAPKDIAREGNQAAHSGTTVVNVYYIRNIYRLEFIYAMEKNGVPAVGVSTRGFANHNETWTGRNNGRPVTDEDLSLIPATQVVTAKYGADLRERDVWPYHSGLEVNLADVTGDTGKGNVAQFISWTTTAGPYNAEALRIGLDDSRSEPTIMGAYGAMSADIICDPAQHMGTADYNETTGTHRLYAYWSDWEQDSYYRYNHCYEVPGVTQELLEAQVGVVKLVIDGQDDTPEQCEDVRNICYLLPADGDGEVLNIIRAYGFEDLKKVDYHEGMTIDQIKISDDGNYYGFRVYQGKCYALVRIVNVASTNNIKAQTPSARLHMHRVNENDVADFSTKWTEGSGGFRRDTAVGTNEEPCQLFFYYDRIPYTILYSVGSKDGVKDLGTKLLFYGAKLSELYDIRLESGESTDGSEDAQSGKTNGEYAASADNPNGWTLPDTSDASGRGTQPVCPDRNERGTKSWAFRGWAMDLAGTALMDSPDDWNGVVNGHLHLYAQWEAPKYTVEFDWDGGQLAFGNDAEYQVQEISANSTVVGGGLTPVPVKSGYYLDHWRATHYKLNEEDGWVTVKVEDYPFRFDQKLSLSLKIQAVWKKIAGAAECTYRVCHVLEGKPAVKVAADQEISGSFVPGYDIWANPIQLGSYQGKDYSAYVPTVQKAGTTVPLDGSDPAPITISYRPPAAADQRYTVRFLANGGSKEILKAELSTAEVTKTVYAGNWQEALDEKGYWLVDADGERADLKSDALVKTLLSDGERTADFPVAEQVYDLEYQWPADMTEETKTALAKNLPKSYTPVKGATALPVPGSGSYKQEEQTYYFKSWKLVRGTLNGETNVELSSVTIAPESRGALTFEAQWSDTPVTPSRPSRPSSSGGDSVRLEREKHQAYIMGRDGGLAAPEANITRAEVAAVFYRLLTEESRRTFDTQANPFGDVTAEDWFFKPAVVLAKAKIVEGYPDGSFAPAANITRGEFAAIAARFLSEKYNGPAKFPDTEGHWAAEYIDRAAQQGWIKGYPDGTFRPDDYITRAEAISLVNAVLGRAPHKEYLLDGMTTWPDNLDEAKWYYLDIQEATNSHEYTWRTVDGDRVEAWTALTE